MGNNSGNNSSENNSEGKSSRNSNQSGGGSSGPPRARPTNGLNGRDINAGNPNGFDTKIISGKDRIEKKMK